MPFKMTKWSENLFKFLDLYETNECLWNPRVEEYTLKGSRDAAIRNILNEMQIPGLTESDIKNKIKSIRTSYKRELTAMLQSKQNYGKVEGAELYEPKLSWFKRADKFLHDVSVNKKANNFKKALQLQVQPPAIKKEFFEAAKPKEDESETQKEIEIIQIKNGHETDPEYEEEEENYDEVYIQEPQFGKDENQNSSVNATPTDPIIYRIEQQNHSNNQNNRKRGHQVQGSANEISILQQEDEFELFGKSIAAQLKRMPLYNAVICQEKIQSIMTHERISIITQASSNKKHRSESHSYQ